ncbi:LytR family transcriptional regulator [Bacillus infantis]|uniref:LytR family transcriptional regulator n=1 Tax=Bacillus infantis TaxID=324767 RepID=A0A5D4RHF8_9BACI|nr:LytR family transcriptional regulator [Bacillus infantis]TYS50300.1 LytR family transcriptional regulator [Bacillus infantis]
MKDFDRLPKSIKKTIRYINQDVKSLEQLDLIEKKLNQQLAERRKKLQTDKS